MTNSKIKIIGISGASNAGKTTISNTLRKMNSGEFSFICMDDFYYKADSPHAVRIADMPIPNFDCMESIDWESLLKEFEEKIRDPSVKYLVIEGIFVFNYEPIASRMDLKIFLTLDRKIMHERRLLRKYVIPEPKDYFDKYAYPAYEKTLDSLANDDRIHFFSGTIGRETIFKTIYQLILDLNETID